MKQLLIAFVGPVAFATYCAATSTRSGSWLYSVAVNAAFIAIPHFVALAVAWWLKSRRVVVLGVLGPNLAIVLFSIWSAQSYWKNGLEWMFYLPFATLLALAGIVAGFTLDKRAKRNEFLSRYGEKA